MSIINMNQVKQKVEEKYSIARANCVLEKGAILKEYAALSNNIPNYDAEKMKFGTYNKEKYVAFFADMRSSTERAVEIGPAKTFLTIHAIMPAMIYIVESYKGYVIDLPGDGVMALFKNNNSIYWGENTTNYLKPEELAVRCGQEMLRAFDKVVNPILANDDIPPVSFGVGIDTGSVIVTKTGTDNTFDTKAIGTCINNAAKKSNGIKQITISSDTYNKVCENLKNQFTHRADNWYVQNI
ncbi:class 3 adenylate cyclase [Clostridium pascui]|uniref:adenylate/guanylate cyclase domain-containing protein n=1 Tax=Clostridium pascui TaxID=46609 RepID=UPI00195A73C4|nr:adenylate/guanylate cyclase domain-containing protein [Clostridium pascui]MBM7872025.1 class 3 adenylate cyclase [Clostridium pascui]